jgi:RHS repeat-associated protein
MATQQLLATDRLLSPLMALGASGRSRAAYTPYGYRPAQDTAPSLGFTGQLPERALGWYLLGNGHRAYNPVLMRFHSADRLSPFGAGGFNAYAYCHGDPINFHDRSGESIIDQIMWRDVTAGVGMLAGGRVGEDTKTLYRMIRSNMQISKARSRGIPAKDLPLKFNATQFISAGASWLSSFTTLAMGATGLGIDDQPVALAAINSVAVLVSEATSYQSRKLSGDSSEAWSIAQNLTPMGPNTGLPLSAFGRDGRPAAQQTVPEAVIPQSNSSSGVDSTHSAAQVNTAIRGDAYLSNAETEV